MTKDVTSVREDTPYAEIVATMAKHKVSSVPVIDLRERVVGIVSEADLLHRVEFLGRDTEAQFLEWGAAKAHRAKANGLDARHLMTTPAITIQPGLTIIAAARRMETKQLKHMPVVDVFGRLLGVVSRSDLLKMYLRTDAQIRQQIVDEVLTGALHLDPLAVQVDVADGVVVLNGHVDRHSAARIALGITRSVPGVVGVVDQIRWSRDDLAMSGKQATA